MTRSALVLALLGSLALTACSGSAPAAPGAGTPPGTPGGGGVTDQAIRSRLDGCAVVNQTSDPAASNCLVGTYTGKTVAKETCTLTVRANGAYDYNAPGLSYSFTPSARASRIFGHSVIASDHRVIWLLDETYQSSDAYELSFDALYGPNADQQAEGSRLEIEATRILSTGGRVASTCLLKI